MREKSIKNANLLGSLFLNPSDVTIMSGLIDIKTFWFVETVKKFCDNCGISAGVCRIILKSFSKFVQPAKFLKSNTNAKYIPKFSPLLYTRKGYASGFVLMLAA